MGGGVGHGLGEGPGVSKAGRGAARQHAGPGGAQTRDLVSFSWLHCAFDGVAECRERAEVSRPAARQDRPRAGRGVKTKGRS